MTHQHRVNYVELLCFLLASQFWEREVCFFGNDREGTLGLEMYRS